MTLWGGRFEDGPSPELVALSRSTHFDWELAPYDIAGSHAHAKALAAAGHLTAADEAGDARGPGCAWPSACAAATWSRPTPTRTCTAPSRRALIAAVGPELGGRLRAGRSRNDQIATLIRMYLLDHARTIEHQVVQLIDAIAAQAAAHPDAVMPGRTHLQHAQPILLAHHLLAHAWPLVRDLERLRDWRVRAPAVAVRRRRARRAARSGSTPRLVARRAEPRRPDAELDRRDGEPGCRGRVRLHRRPDRHRPVAVRRGRHPLGDARVRLRPAARRLLDRVVDHAAEEEPRHRRARARQGGAAGRQPDRAARPRSRACRSRTTATCRRTRSRCSTPCAPSRCCCRRSPAWSRPSSSTPRAWRSSRRRASRSRPTSPTTSCGTGVPFRDAHEIAGRARAVLRGARASSSTSRPTPTTPRSTRGSRPTCATCSPSTGSIASRSGVGGTAPERVAEQLAALTAAVRELLDSRRNR